MGIVLGRAALFFRETNIIPGSWYCVALVVEGHLLLSSISDRRRTVSF